MAFTFRPTYDALETRDTPAITANLSAGILAIQGTDYDDRISISQSAGRVWLSGVSPEGNLYQNFSQYGISQIVVTAEQGDDTVTFAWGVKIPARIFGNSGNDLIYGGSGADIIYGGEGSDRIYSRPGNDIVFGGPDWDTLSDTIGTNTLIQGSPSRSYYLNAAETAVLALVNQARASAGVAPLTANSKLAFAARTQSLNMAARSMEVGDGQAMKHTLYGTTSPTNTGRVDLAGYDDWTWIGENIAYGYTSPQSVFTAWMNSPGHRSNILSADYTEIGISLAYNARGVAYWTQTFGSRVW